MGEHNAGVALINLIGVETSLAGVDMASMLLREESLCTVHSLISLAGVETASMLVRDPSLFSVYSNVFLVGVETALMLVRDPSLFPVYSMDLLGVERRALDESRDSQLVEHFTLLAASEAKSDGEGCNETDGELCCTSSVPFSLNFKENRALKDGAMWEGAVRCSLGNSADEVTNDFSSMSAGSVLLTMSL